MKDRFLKWWYLRVKNTKVREGEAGGFKWCFRRFTLDIETVSGNFKVRFTADEHPYAYLLAGKTDENIEGFAKILYQVGMLLTTEQKFADDIQMALVRYNDRLEGTVSVEENEAEEQAALETERQIQEFIEKPKKERRKLERDINGRFKKAVKDAEKHELPE